MNHINRSPFDFRHLINVGEKPTPPASKNPIHIEVILHEDIPYPTFDGELMKKNLNAAKKELERATGRKVEITLNQDPNLRAFQYKYKGNVHRDLEDNMARFERMQNKPINESSAKLHKYLLVTPSSIKGHIGVGAPDSKVGVAALNDDRGIAHAIGHMFGATHVDAAVTYNGWWNDTLMNVDASSAFRGNDFTYSEKNRANIRKHFSELA